MPGSIAHPPALAVAIVGGTREALVPKWTMAKRALIKPKIAALFNHLSAGTGGSLGSLADLFMVAEDQLVEICREAVLLPDDMAWDDVLWEDIPNLVQAVWDHNVITTEGGGIAGKLAPMVQPLLLAAQRSTMITRAIENAKPPQSTDPSPTTNETPQS